MARQKSKFVSATGTTFEIFKTLAEEVYSAGGNDDNLRRILKEQRLRQQIAKLLVANPAQDTAPRPTLYPVEIDYSDTFKQRLAAGRYDWKNSDITEKHFPIKGEGQIRVDLEIVHYNVSLSTEAVLAVINAQGYRPATIEELLAFGATYPELQREFPIVALGSVWRLWFGDRRVAYLGRYGRVRLLGLDRPGPGWGALRRFLVVRKRGEVYQLDVFGHSINDLVKQGNYGWSNADINDDHFPVLFLSQNEIILKHFGKNMSTDAVLKALDAEGLRPATMSELLALGAKHPRLQEEFPIVELGSVWQHPNDHRCVGVLDYHDGQRKLYLDWIEFVWHDGYRFAAVRK